MSDAVSYPPRPRADSPAIQIDDVSKSFHGTWALRGVSLSIQPGEIRALVGANGSGKSTLIKVLAGIHRVDGEGVISVAGAKQPLERFSPSNARDLGLRFVHQNVPIFDDLTVCENLFLGMGFATGVGRRIRWRAARKETSDALDRFGIAGHPEQLAGELTPANRMMLTIARALHGLGETGAALLCLDEPTAALPAPEVEVLLTALRRYAEQGQAILYVSHRLDEVLALADSVTVLRDGRLVMTTPAAELDQQSLLAAIAGREVGALGVGDRSKRQNRKPVLELVDLESGSLSGINLGVEEGEVVGIAGLLGSGRSTLLRTVAGDRRPSSGEIRIAGHAVSFDSVRDSMRAGIAFVPEDRGSSAMFAELSVMQNLTIADRRRYARYGWMSGTSEQQATEKAIGDYRIVTASSNALMETLSGGNQQKVIIARWLLRKPRLMLLDEPTQGVDGAARVDIHRLIRRAVGTECAALIVSSDFEELVESCDRVVVLRRGTVVAELQGTQLSEDQIIDVAYSGGLEGTLS